MADGSKQPVSRSPLCERLRDGFHIVVTEAAEAVSIALSGEALALLCPLCQNGGVSVRLSRVRDSLPPPPHDGAVWVVIEIALLRGILGSDFDHLPRRVADAIAGGDQVIPKTAELALAAHAIRRCDHQGAIRNVFLKSKALEMIALALGTLRENTGEPVSARDARAVTRARDFLLDRLDDPPRLNELAAVAGMCETRLKLGFKRLFGDTPAGFSRRARMSAARAMLVERRCQVSEAAVAVGYTNVSHFIDAFSREFGVRPGALARLTGAVDAPPDEGKADSRVDNESRSRHHRALS